MPTLRADSPAAGLSRVRVCLSGRVPGRAEAAGLRPSSADDLGGLLEMDVPGPQPGLLKQELGERGRRIPTL